MLKHKVEIYIPNNNPKQKKVMMRVFEDFCEEFGGASINPVLGGWIDGKGQLVTDKIGIIYSYTDKIKPTWIKALAICIREEMLEDAITVVIDDQAEFY